MLLTHPFFKTGGGSLTPLPPPSVSAPDFKSYLSYFYCHGSWEYPVEKSRLYIRQNYLLLILLLSLLSTIPAVRYLQPVYALALHRWIVETTDQPFFVHLGLLLNNFRAFKTLKALNQPKLKTLLNLLLLLY